MIGGALDMLRRRAGGGDKIIEDVVQLTNTPEGIQANSQHRYFGQDNRSPGPRYVE